MPSILQRRLPRLGQVPKRNLLIYLRSDRGIILDTSGTPSISQWSDQSGNSNHYTQPTKVRQPFLKTENGFTAVSLEGSQYLVGMNFPALSSFTAYIVTTASSGVAYEGVFRFQTDTNTYVVYPWNTTALAIISSDGGASGLSSGFQANTWNKGVFTYSLNTVNGFQTFNNESLIAQRDSGSTPLPIGMTGTIGCFFNNGNPNNFSTAKIKCILLYSMRHTQPEIQKIVSKL